MTCQVEIKVSKWSIHIKSPYNERMNAKYRSRGGEYRKEEGEWLLPRLDPSYELLKEEFNWVPDCSVTQITVPVDGEGVIDHGTVVYYKGYVLASRSSRNSYVKTYDGVVANGDYQSWGGSYKHPEVLHGSEVTSWNIMAFDGIPGKKASNPLSKFSTEQLLEEIERRKQCEPSQSDPKTS